MKTTSRTEKKRYAFEHAPRCGARTKGNNGNPCRCPAIRGKARCRVHGGAKGSGAKHGNTNALKNGEHTVEAKTFRLEIRKAIQC
ncbi:TPA: hypothetical protein VAH50_002875, partial [Legionella pneumophila]|nr:hypothetical protein [Legionella pneumophila]